MKLIATGRFDFLKCIHSINISIFTEMNSNYQNSNLLTKQLHPDLTQKNSIFFLLQLMGVMKIIFQQIIRSCSWQSLIVLCSYMEPWPCLVMTLIWWDFITLRKWLFIKINQRKSEGRKFQLAWCGILWMRLHLKSRTYYLVGLKVLLLFKFWSDLLSWLVKIKGTLRKEFFSSKKSRLNLCGSQGDCRGCW